MATITPPGALLHGAACCDRCGRSSRVAIPPPGFAMLSAGGVAPLRAVVGPVERADRDKS